MFTGTIREVGTVRGFSEKGNSHKLAVESEAISEDAKIGDSVSVNGVCLTVTDKAKGLVYFDAVGETIRRTNLQYIRPKDAVNLEAALKVGDPIGGHFVLGHVDCVGRITAVERGAGDTVMELEVPEKSAGGVVEKGSVAVEGVSLTVGGIKANRFKIYLIPHTLKATTLGLKEAGDLLNIEFDIIGKHISRLSENPGYSGITEEFLQEKGFS